MCQFRHFLLSALLMIPALLYAASPELKTEHPQRYVVQYGDTLWDIAGRFLRDPWRWREIWHENPDVENPNRIYPGDELVLSMVEGKLRLTVERANRAQRRYGGMREVKLSPQMRREELVRPIHTIPIDAIQQFLTRPKVMSQQELKYAPRVVAFVDEHIVGGAGDAVYVSEVEDDFIRNFDLVRAGDVYRDPDSGDILGYEALYVGDAELMRPGQPAKIMVTTTETEVLLDDRMLPDPEAEVLDNFQPGAGPLFLEGKIIKLLGGVNQIGQLDVVVINKGSDDGLEPGHVMNVLQRSDPPRGSTRSGLFRRTPELPLEQVGALMVFRPFERVSYALIMDATSSLHVGDTFRSPEE